MTPTPTSDAVLDALVKAVIEQDTLITIGRGSVMRSLNVIEAFSPEENMDSIFPATREGLVAALIFAGLAIEGGGE